MGKSHSGQPPRAKQVQLVEARGRALGAVLMSAPYKVEDRLRARFEAMRAKMASDYPEVDLESGTFYEALYRHAKAWWDKRTFRGPGVDW